MASITYYIGQNNLLIDDIIRGMDVGILEVVDMIYYNKVTREQAERVKEILGLEEPVDELFECLREKKDTDESSNGTPDQDDSE